MAECITKTQLLREARRVYGDELVSVAEEKYFSERHFRFTTEVILKKFRSGVFVQTLSRAEARRMTLAALKAAGDAR